MPGPVPSAWLDVLAGSHDRLGDLVCDLGARHLRRRSYCDEWSIAQVLSHLGSGAEIMDARIDAALAGGTPPGAGLAEQLWARWDAMTAEEQRDGFLAADGHLVERLEHLGDRLDDLHVASGDGALDAAGLLGERLTEHALHAWDVHVVLDPGAKVEADAVSLLVDRLPAVARRAARADGVAGDCPFTLAVETSDPERHFLLTVATSVVLERTEGGRPGPGAAAVTALALPAERFLRLVCGRLDVGHRAQWNTESTAIVHRLQQVFAGF